MSIKKWQEIARQKEEVENQRKNILLAFKERKVKDEMGLIGAEKLFQPITRRMEKIPEDQFIVPDYDIDDQTRNFKNVLSSCQEEISGTSEKVSKSPQNPSPLCSNSSEFIRTYSYLLI